MKNIQNISLPPFQAMNYQLAIDEFWSVEDVKWMHEALNLAKQGAEHGEVPVGAILVHNQQIIGQGFNEPIRRHDATAHAEIIALRDACRRLNNYRLPLQTTLYVTLEPCTMCIGALIHARVDRLIYAASEPRAGMVGSQMNLAAEPFYNHRIQVYKGLCREHSSQMLKAFFRQRRQASKRKER
ncbi:tRNA adenosine(34) deaminase TadA [uncultured Psychrobacter sp.]|uniref:tRNA adenosine(34) deaminase TadA n=1 Tax=uncultured Psychrobacter sp. TaxID=259303 RepID=UPI00259419BE|nr:tRNA adenosine(34) deaminase TadA [uncultured Psychrobacter sp.]